MGVLLSWKFSYVLKIDILRNSLQIILGVLIQDTHNYLWGISGLLKGGYLG